MSTPRSPHAPWGTSHLDSPHPLAEVRVCLVFEHSLSHYSRILMEITALQDAGATVQLLTSHRDEHAPPGVQRTIAPLDSWVPGSTIAWRPLRIAHNLTRNATHAVVCRVHPERYAKLRAAALHRIVPDVDLFWVVDSLSLPSVLKATKGSGVRVLYETVDLVPEYHYRRLTRLRQERRAIGNIDGFITACDSYAEYYIEKYGDVLRRPPMVRDNMPAEIASQIKPTSRPLRILFLGSLMFDRPVTELIQAMTLVRNDATLTFQGKNFLGDELSALIDELALGDRVRLLAPCPAEAIVTTAGDYDVGIVALRGLDENERLASTSKLFTFMAAGLAILGSNLPGIARVVEAYGNGILVHGIKPEDWAGAIDEMALLPVESIDAMKQRSLEAAHLHSWERQAPEYVAEFVRALAE